MLITLGFILMAGAAIVFLFNCLNNVISAILKAIYGIMSYIGNQIFLKNKLESDGTLQRYQFEQELKKAEKDAENRQKMKNEHDKVVYAILSKIAELKTKYPLADQELFNEYRDNFMNIPVEFLDNIEDKIKKQHFERSQHKTIGDYNKEDLDKYEIIDQTENVYNKSKIKTTLYKDKNNYIVRLENPDNCIDEIFVTPNIILAKHVQHSLIAKCQVNWIHTRLDENAIINLDDFQEVVGNANREYNKYKAAKA